MSSDPVAKREEPTVKAEPSTQAHAPNGVPPPLPRAGVKIALGTKIPLKLPAGAIAGKIPLPKPTVKSVPFPTVAKLPPKPPAGTSSSTAASPQGGAPKQPAAVAARSVAKPATAPPPSSSKRYVAATSGADDDDLAMLTASNPTSTVKREVADGSVKQERSSPTPKKERAPRTPPARKRTRSPTPPSASESQSSDDEKPLDDEEPGDPEDRETLFSLALRKGLDADDAPIEEEKVTVELPPQRPQYTRFPSNIDAKIAAVKESLRKVETDMLIKEQNKTLSLGTSKTNYIDPRIVVSWAKQFNVPVARIFSKTQQEKFPWAMDAKDFTF